MASNSVTFIQNFVKIHQFKFERDTHTHIGNMAVSYKNVVIPSVLFHCWLLTVHASLIKAQRDYVHHCSLTRRQNMA